MDKTKQQVLLTRGSGILSFLIALFERDEWSHTAIRYWDEEDGCWNIIETTSGGVQCQNWEVFKAHNKIIRGYECATDLLPVIKKYKLLQKGRDEYDYPALLGFIWIKFMWLLFKIRIQNPLNNPYRWVCSGFVNRVFRESHVKGYFEPIEAEYVDPDFLDEFMSKSPEFEKWETK